MRVFVLSYACALVILRITHYVSADGNASFVFNGFSGNNIRLSGVAGIENGLIQLTNTAERQLGHAFYLSPVQVKKASKQTITSFSTTFVFSISPLYETLGGHGMAFVMAPSLSRDGAYPSQYLGMLNSTNDNQTYNHLFAVEFDTVQDLEFGDTDDNHVGININSMRSVYAEKAGYWTKQHNASNCSCKTEINLKSEKAIQTWIAYDGHSQVLNVTIAPVGSPRPSIPLLSANIELLNVLEENMYVGFTASTGVISGTHRVLAWSFNSNGEALSLDLSKLPWTSSSPPLSSKARFKIWISLSIVMVLLGVCALVGCIICMKTHREVVENWEIEFGLHRYDYKELQKATRNFADEELLGVGGFGRVYRGVLPKSNLEVAVKQLSRGSDQGEKEFIAEMASTGKLQHHNLVKLLGWSRRRGELILVYEYMPYRSLDKALHGRSEMFLRWEQRHKILKGIASGILYLHEGWERQVLHRDIKSSNVLLDANMNARVSDFGLARLYEHGQHPHTTRVVGTLGYLAPEFARTGRANTSTDVYSFGVLVLEVVTGRRPIEHQVSVEDFLLVDRVLDLYLKGRHLEAVDPRLDGLFDAEEITKVLALGLLCVHADPLRRPSMRQVEQVLAFGASLPTRDLNSQENVKEVTIHSFTSLSSNNAWNSVDASTHLSAR